VRELGHAPFLGLVRGLARKRKVADLGRRDTGLQLMLDDAQEERRFSGPQSRGAEDFGDLRPQLLFSCVHV
jgi:hypothetical protein